MNGKKQAVYLLGIVISAMFFYMLVKGHFLKSFQHAKTTILDGPRMPLWYPYEIMGNGHGAELFDWRGHMEKSFRSDLSGFEKDMLFLRKIKNFNFTESVLWGVRIVEDEDSVTAKQDRRFFIFATNMTDAVYFTNETEFLRTCRIFGVDGMSRAGFDSHYKLFVDNDEKPTVSRIFEFLVSNPLKEDEAIGCIICLLLGFYFCARAVAKLECRCIVSFLLKNQRRIGLMAICLLVLVLVIFVVSNNEVCHLNMGDVEQRLQEDVSISNQVTCVARCLGKEPAVVYRVLNESFDLDRFFRVYSKQRETDCLKRISDIASSCNVKIRFEAADEVFAYYGGGYSLLYLRSNILSYLLYIAETTRYFPLENVQILNGTLGH